MKSIIIKLTLLILALNLSVTAQKSKTNKSPTKSGTVIHNLNNDTVPLFVFTYIIPWRQAYGSDSPEFVLYQDGTVIFTKCREKDNPYSCYFRTAKLSSDEISQTMEKLNPQAFYSFDNRYSPDTSEFVVSDLTERLLVMRKPDGTYKQISTYGALSGDKKGYAAENVPNALKEIVDFATSYDNEKSEGWFPEYIEIVLIPYLQKSEKNLKWSKDLPDLTDSKTIKHKEYGRYSLFVPRSLQKKLVKIRREQRESDAAVLIDKEKWKIELRTPFSSEKIWLGNFRE